ncbi:MAG: prepilin-type N-terminal cleavage/methylation domain-containing protein [Methylococcales bacterium]|nr:prepilin-type N-terminal cleavage/methylation domain-containing protein [Methylococcales bacterium]
MNRQPLSNKQQGFSMLELAVVLMILAIIAGIFFAATPGRQANSPVSSSAAKQALQEESQFFLEGFSGVLFGFITANSRLPCPDSDNDGVEDCADGIRAGALPHLTLGLTSPVTNSDGQKIIYAVYRAAQADLSHDIDLAVAKNRFQPFLPPQYNQSTATPSLQTNGVDFCWALRTLARQAVATDQAHVRIGSNNVNTAYLLVNPGKRDADNDGRFLDGLNQQGNPVLFESPQTKQTDRYDDVVFAQGSNELAARLQCPALLSKVNGSARSAKVAYDAYRLAVFYRDYRQFAEKLRELDLDMAKAAVTRATMEVTVVAVSQATLAAAAAGNPTVSGGMVALGVGAAAASIAGAALALDSANKKRDDAQTAYDLAKMRTTQAETARNAAQKTATDQLNIALTTDQKGWFQQ